MKKLCILAMALNLAWLCGCSTAKAYTKKTTPDGTVTESSVSVTGTGDKASQIAAEGLFADGSDDDLGAGVKNASASQESTGVADTIRALTQFAAAMYGLGSAQSAPLPAPQAQPQATQQMHAPSTSCPTCAPGVDN